MNLKLTEVTAAILAALNADLGTFDLSATDAVKEGTYNAPSVSVPFAAVAPPHWTETPVARERWFRVEATYNVTLWGAFTTDTTGNRSQRSALLADEAKTALVTARRTGANNLYKCRQFYITGGMTDPALDQSTEFVTAKLTIKAVFLRSNGIGA